MDSLSRSSTSATRRGPKLPPEVKWLCVPLPTARLQAAHSVQLCVNLSARFAATEAASSRTEGMAYHGDASHGAAHVRIQGIRLPLLVGRSPAGASTVCVTIPLLPPLSRNSL